MPVPGHIAERDRNGVFAREGTVYLVGAGPGDPGLITVKARDLIASCDVVVYDHLVSPAILARIRHGAERLYAGKIGHGPQTSQARINALLVERARARCSVVRLKGGDPFVFGRGAEEAEALWAAGVPFEIVPGISAAIAAPAYAGIPLTRREVASSVAIVSGRCANGQRSLNSAALAADTLVILMPLRGLRDIVADLVVAGRSPETPAAVVASGTRPDQRTITGVLHTIADRVERAGLEPPGVMVVGEVVRLRERLQWLAERHDPSATTDNDGGIGPRSYKLVW
jgi:uroporphyrinogen III methyltransferase/synthase